MFKTLAIGVLAVGAVVVVGTVVQVARESSEIARPAATATTSTGASRGAPEGNGAEGRPTIEPARPADVRVPDAAAAAPTTLVVMIAPPTVPGAAAPELAAAATVPAAVAAATPGPVRDLLVTADGTDRAIASWAGEDGLEYELELVGPDGALLAALRTPADQWSIGGLRPATSYTVRVRGVVAATGSGGPWAEAAVRTPPA